MEDLGGRRQGGPTMTGSVDLGQEKTNKFLLMLSQQPSCCYGLPGCITDNTHTYHRWAVRDLRIF